MNDRTCTVCGLVASGNDIATYFLPRSDRPGKYLSKCRDCERLRRHKYNIANADKSRERYNRWYAANKEHALDYDRRYNANPDAVRKMTYKRIKD